jgi:hypothetical protein
MVLPILVYTATKLTKLKSSYLTYLSLTDTGNIYNLATIVDCLMHVYFAKNIDNMLVHQVGSPN